MANIRHKWLKSGSLVSDFIKYLQAQIFLDKPPQANYLLIHPENRPYFDIVFSCILKTVELLIADISDTL